ncbi:MAG: PKD domain-containing protein [Thermoplasmatales archaeon]|nr:MAG: PKD domain-containing protein [Thermoplasmatales archaeon]
MKYIVNKENILKGAGVLLIILILLVSNLAVIANTTTDKIKQNNQTNKSSCILHGSSFSESISNEGFGNGGLKWIVMERFEKDTIPENWTQDINNTAATWELMGDNPHSSPWYAMCYPGDGPQDEWLITMSVNFTGYKEIYLAFCWETNWWWAVHQDKCDLNVCISIDGSEWTVIWNENNSVEFEPFSWYDTTFGNYIDLSEYINETNVKIGFQYYSESGGGCAVGIDDVRILVNDPTNTLTCYAGGNYTAKAAETIYFYGEASGGQKPYDWHWDFGDGKMMKNVRNPTYKYYELGIYNVTLTVEEKSGDRNWIATDYAEVNITEPDQIPPTLEIENIRGPFGIRATLNNTKGENITNVEWEMHIRGAGFNNIFSTIVNGSFDKLAMGEPKEISSKYFVGFGRIKIKIMAEGDNVQALSRERKALKFGPFVLNIRE